MIKRNVLFGTRPASLDFGNLYNPTRIRVEIPPVGCSYLDLGKLRDLVRALMNVKNEHGRLRYESVADFCNQLSTNTGLGKTWMMLHRSDLYWGDTKIKTLALYLGVDPSEITLVPERPEFVTIVHQKTRRPQDFVHDRFIALVNTEMTSKKLTGGEYNRWLAMGVDCAARTIYNLRNGTANPSNILVSNLARHFNINAGEFYR